MRAIRFANGVLLLTAAAGVAVLLSSLARRDRLPATPAAALLYFGLPALAAAGSLALLRLRPAYRINVAVVLAATALSLYAAELLLALLGPPTGPRVLQAHRRAAAERTAVGFDGRSKLEVVEALRRRGVDAYPAVTAGMRSWQPRLRRRLGAGAPPRDPDLVPLAGVPDRVTVFCNESGEWIVYQSDEHGFHNPPGLWDGPAPDIVAVGDSYVHGECVRSDESLPARIRARHPATVNLGLSGGGPVLALATLREYAPSLRPRVVLWVYFENDLRDLDAERRDRLLARYLSPGFRQDLPARRREIDRRLAGALDAELADARRRRKGRLATTAAEIAELRHLRARLPSLPRALSLSTPWCCDVELFGAIVAEAQRLTASLGGTMYFVFLPAWDRFDSRARTLPAELQAREQVLARVRALGIPVIDVYASLRRHGDPGALFLYPGSHYSPAGYRAVAQAVLDALPPPR